MLYLSVDSCGVNTSGIEIDTTCGINEVLFESQLNQHCRVLLLLGCVEFICVHSLRVKKMWEGPHYHSSQNALLEVAFKNVLF